MKTVVAALLITIMTVACGGGSSATPTPSIFAQFPEETARTMLIAEINKICTEAPEATLSSVLSLAQRADGAEEVDHWKFRANDPLGGIFLVDVYQSGEMSGSLIPTVERICGEETGSPTR